VQQDSQPSQAPTRNNGNGGYRPNTNSRTTNSTAHTSIYTPLAKTASSGPSTATHTYTPGASSSGSTSRTITEGSSNGNASSSVGVTTYTPHARSSGSAKIEHEGAAENPARSLSELILKAEALISFLVKSLMAK
jgi:hypothetical protein